MIRSTLIAGAAAVLLLGVSTTTRADDPNPVVVELFTSQGCYSCPPAEHLLTGYAAREDLIALEFHVDYWNDLVYGAAGKWVDPFSDRAYTLRQQAYNRSIRKRSMVYTPQTVIGGARETVGSRGSEIEQAIDTQQAKNDIPLRVSFDTDSRGGMVVRVEGDRTEAAAIWLVRFLRERETEVKAGENKGKTLISRNIVTGVERLGPWAGRAAALRIPPDRGPDAEHGCAVLVQSDDLGPILGASYCPGPTS